MSRGEAQGGGGQSWRGACCAAASVVVAAVLLGGCDPKDSAATGQVLPNVLVIGGLGDTPGRFAYPRAVEADRDGVWVIDKSGRVQKFDAQSNEVVHLFRMPKIDIGKPTGFGIAPGRGTDGVWHSELLYIADSHYHRVMVYAPPKVRGRDAQGAFAPATLVAQFGSYGDQPGQFYYPTDVCILTNERGDAIERIYVSEYGGNDRVSIFDANYQFIKSFGVLGPGNDPRTIEFSRPQSMVVRTRTDGQRELLVTDSCNHRIGRFTLDGELIGWIGHAPTAARELGELSYPHGLHVLPDGTLLVTEYGHGRVQRMRIEDGQSLGAWSGLGEARGVLAGPWAVTGIGWDLWALDSGNSRMVRFRLR